MRLATPRFTASGWRSWRDFRASEILTAKELLHYPQKVIKLIVMDPMPGIGNSHNVYSLGVTERLGPAVFVRV